MNDNITALASSPLVIGATGGSGTRVVARIARRAGYDLGSHLNDAEDALEFVGFHDRWINRVMAAERRPLSSGETDQMICDFHSALRRHLPTHGESGQLWGWKAPRSIYFLSFFHSLFPALKFIHVLRDGRDMAFSDNQKQLRQHGRVILSWRERWFAAGPLRSILLWDRVNRRAASYGEAQLGCNYLAVRFEDLCRRPTRTVERILCFLGSKIDAPQVADAEISPPATLARWKTRPEAITQKLNAAAATSLRKFNYLQESALRGG